MNKLLIILLLAKSVQEKELKPDINQALLDSARKLSSEAHYTGSKFIKYNYLVEMATTPLLPNIVVLGYTTSFKERWEWNPRKCYYVGVDTAKGFVKLMEQKSFNDFVDTSNVTRIANEKDAVDYAKFILRVVYKQEILDGSTDIKERARLFLKETLSDSAPPSEDYLPKVKTTPDGYYAVAYAYINMNRQNDYVGYFFFDKWLLCIKRNGMLQDAGRMKISTHKKLQKDTLAYKNNKKCFVQIEPSDSLLKRKALKCPLPPVTKGAQIHGTLATLKLGIKIDPDGKIIGKPVILITTDLKDWDEFEIKWLKDNWRWEKSDSETNGTITIKFSWIEK